MIYILTYVYSYSIFCRFSRLAKKLHRTKNKTKPYNLQRNLEKLRENKVVKIIIKNKKNK